MALGHSFNESRKIILKGLQDIHQKYGVKEEKSTVSVFFNQKSYYFSILNIFIVVTIIVLLSVSSSNVQRDLYVELVLSISVIVFMILFNYLLHRFYYNSSKDELHNTIKKIIHNYKKFVDDNETRCNLPPNLPNDRPILPPDINIPYDADIKAGSAHISIVPCYRNNQWHRMPILLLAEGDIIALQCGDVTPGQCIEINATMNNMNKMTSTNNTSTGSTATATGNNIDNGALNSSGLNILSPHNLDIINNNKYDASKNPIVNHCNNDNTHIHQNNMKNASTESINHTNYKMIPKGTTLTRSNSIYSTTHHTESIVTHKPTFDSTSSLPVNTNNIISASSETTNIINNSMKNDNKDIDKSNLTSCEQQFKQPTTTDTQRHRPSSSTTLAPITMPTPTTPPIISSKKYSYLRHKAVASDDIELLSLSGDMRCFQLLETPILSYIEKEIIINYEYELQHKRQSLLRLFFYDIITKGYYFLLLNIILLILCAIIRFALLPMTRHHYGLVLLTPIASTMICFIPLFLPCFMLIAEILLTANFLSTIETIFNTESDNSINKTTAKVNGIKSVQDRKLLQKKTNSMMTRKKSPQTNISVKDKKNRKNTRNSNVLLDDSYDEDETNEDEDEESNIDNRHNHISTHTQGNHRVHGDSTHITHTTNDHHNESNDDDDVNNNNDGNDMISEDEFHDEDIDDRVDELADNISTQVLWSRLVHYSIIILCHRLGWYTLQNWYIQLFKLTHFLSVPHAKCHLFEFLGGITMVCFVDDDIICESYSVTEEIFLLKHNEKIDTYNESLLTNTTHGNTSIPKNTMTSTTTGTTGTGADYSMSSPNTTTTMHNNTTQVHKGHHHHGYILDLHANPEAHGSRFEDPQWWKTLSSLKPIGLNALLTYAPISTTCTSSPTTTTTTTTSNGMNNDNILSPGHHYISHDNNSSIPMRIPMSSGMSSPLSSGHENNDSFIHVHPTTTTTMMLNDENQSARMYTSNRIPHDINVTKESSLLNHNIAMNHINGNPAHNTTINGTNNTSQYLPIQPKKYSRIMEKSLVNLVRTTIPIESLRELAEEIGFTSNDISSFYKILEMNVIAPGLVDAKLMEDTHAWSHEDSRRRGTLMTQVRSSIVLDLRSKGLQMLSQGDPSLILHYCGEYWDGTSITPFTAYDRKELLSVYDRWRLEDFDVVAFAYTPISVDLRQRILQTYLQIDDTVLRSHHHHHHHSSSSTKRHKHPWNTSQYMLSSLYSSIRHSQQQSTSPSGVSLPPTPSNCLYIVDPYTMDDVQIMRVKNAESMENKTITATTTTDTKEDETATTTTINIVDHKITTQSTSDILKKSTDQNDIHSSHPNNSINNLDITPHHSRIVSMNSSESLTSTPLTPQHTEKSNVKKSLLSEIIAVASQRTKRTSFMNFYHRSSLLRLSHDKTIDNSTLEIQDRNMIISQDLTAPILIDSDRSGDVIEVIDIADTDNTTNVDTNSTMRIFPTLPSTMSFNTTDIVESQHDIFYLPSKTPSPDIMKQPSSFSSDSPMIPITPMKPFQQYMQATKNFLLTTSLSSQSLRKLDTHTSLSRDTNINSGNDYDIHISLEEDGDHIEESQSDPYTSPKLSPKKETLPRIRDDSYIPSYSTTTTTNVTTTRDSLNLQPYLGFFRPEKLWPSQSLILNDKNISSAEYHPNTITNAPITMNEPSIACTLKTSASDTNLSYYHEQASRTDESILLDTTIVSSSAGPTLIVPQPSTNNTKINPLVSPHTQVFKTASKALSDSIRKLFSRTNTPATIDSENRMNIGMYIEDDLTNENEHEVNSDQDAIVSDGNDNNTLENTDNPSNEIESEVQALVNDMIHVHSRSTVFNEMDDIDANIIDETIPNSGNNNILMNTILEEEQDDDRENISTLFTHSLKTHIQLELENESIVVNPSDAGYETSTDLHSSYDKLDSDYSHITSVVPIYDARTNVTKLIRKPQKVTLDSDDYSDSDMITIRPRSKSYQGDRHSSSSNNQLDTTTETCMSFKDLATISTSVNIDENGFNSTTMLAERSTLLSKNKFENSFEQTVVRALDGDITHELDTSNDVSTVTGKPPLAPMNNNAGSQSDSVSISPDYIHMLPLEGPLLLRGRSNSEPVLDSQETHDFDKSTHSIKQDKNVYGNTDVSAESYHNTNSSKRSRKMKSQNRKSRESMADSDHMMPINTTTTNSNHSPIKIKKSGSQKKIETKKLRSISASLWPFMRNQVFLGMTASSIPIKSEIADFREELNNAGIRFVYFSPRNMRRSKSVAEKLGIPFDWNCAISLRDLDGEEEVDPHRVISTYGDWDVHAKLPHGVEAIKKHLQEVDNVPLLVSLYTDATPTTINDMIHVFQDYGEVVLSIGSSYRSYNQTLFNTSDVAVAVAMLPGDSQDTPHTVYEVVERFPVFSMSQLTQADILLHLELISLGTIPLLQSNKSHRHELGDDFSHNNILHKRESEDKLSSSKSFSASSQIHSPLSTTEQQPLDIESTTSEYMNTHLSNTSLNHTNNTMDIKQASYQSNNNNTMYGSNMSSTYTHTNDTTTATGFNESGTYALNMLQGIKDKYGRPVTKELQLSALLEGIRMGRVYLLNSFQVIASLCVCCVGMGLWPLLSQALPYSITPSLEPSTALLFMLIYIPCLLLATLNNESPDNVMKNTPRKNKYIQRKNEIRFLYYLILRSGYIGLSVFLTGWFTIASTTTTMNEWSWENSMILYRTVLSPTNGTTNVQYNLKKYLLVHDMMSCSLLLSIITQILTLQKRGQNWRQFPHPFSHPWIYLAILITLLLHMLFTSIRSYLRMSTSSSHNHIINYSTNALTTIYEEKYNYTDLDWRVWVILCILPLGGILLGLVLNEHDSIQYKRYMQYLRFDFETRLGQYSPR